MCLSVQVFELVLQWKQPLDTAPDVTPKKSVHKVCFRFTRVSSREIARLTKQSNGWMEDYFSKIWLLIITVTLHTLSNIICNVWKLWGSILRKKYSDKPLCDLFFESIGQWNGKNATQARTLQLTLTTIFADVRLIRLSMNSPLAPQNTQWRTPG